MRFAAYAGTSVVLATGTIIRAFYERTNFYSASVAIAQSNASLMILTNVALLGVSMFMLGLQRLFFGQLRPVEVEQLYEKAWFAITETCLAMTIFREEVGGWFLVMFVSLLIGKVWGWIGEGRVEILEQQPPTNPSWFHAQLSTSLLISLLFDSLMLQYAVNTVLRHARPNMMVMFAFEFAVLTIASLSTAARYAISVFEANVIKKQIHERRAQIRRERQQAQLEAATSHGAADEAVNASTTINDEDIDNIDIDPPGWEEKGRWIFYLDLTTDFLKLVLYLTFFCVLCMFYGMPIHIIRDVALTIRSFYKRITDFVRYRQATRDMNARYPDATPEEIAREDVCIICREDMRPWSQQEQNRDVPAADRAANGAAAVPIDERARPKKLPCGHILHFACLRSWLERQQNCPTCRRPVLLSNSVSRNDAANPMNQHERPQPQAPAIAAPAQVPGQGGPAVQHLPPAQNVYQFGPLRIAFGNRQGRQVVHQNHAIPTPDLNNADSAVGSQPHNGNTMTRQGMTQRTIASFSPATASSRLQQIEQQLMREINALQLQHEQLYLVRALQGELMRLRQTQTAVGTAEVMPVVGNSEISVPIATPAVGNPAFTSTRQTRSTDTNHQQLPAGMTLPEGWSFLPLRRVAGFPAPTAEPVQPPSSGPPVEAVNASTIDTVTSSHAPDTIPTHDVSTVTDPDRVGSSTNRSPIIGSTRPLPGASHHDSARSPIDIPRQVTREDTNASLAQSAPDPPDWGSDSAALQDEGLKDSGMRVPPKPGPGEGGPQNEPSTESSVGGQKEKGKGKAASIEDMDEDAAMP